MTHSVLNICRVTMVVVCTFSFLATTIVFAKDTDRRPSPFLTRPGGLAGALLGGGFAFNSDLSAIETNPAGLSLNKSVIAGAEFFWKDKFATATEVGILDSKMSDLTAAFKARQATEDSGGIDRRFTLGFAGQPGEYPILLGIAGDYMQVKTPNIEKPEEEDESVTYKSLRFGGIYQIQTDVSVGFRSGGYFSDPQILESGVGAAFGFAENYVGTIDLNVIDKSARLATFGLTVLAKGYLDLTASYGYDLEEQINAGALGIVVKSNIVRVFYTGAKGDLSHSDVEHSVGARLSIEF